MSDLDLSNPFDPDKYRSGPREPALTPSRPPDAPAEDRSPAPPGPDPAQPPQAPTATDPVVNDPAAADPAAAARRPAPWKAAASSVPRLRQQPAAPLEPPPADGEFPGFAQDLPARNAPALGQAAESATADALRTSPLAAPPPPWAAWLGRARALPKSLVIGVAVLVLAGAAVFTFVLPHGEPSIPLARIRQHPEAFDGKRVKVRGRAGETFQVGGSYVFDLRQGRDTIVVYSSTRRPSLHQRVEATGMVSIGYLDGAPRLALFETPQTP